MVNNEKRKVGQMVGKGSSAAELIYGSLSGMAFGLISPLASQPFDTIKTKMQAQASFAEKGPFSVARGVLKADGVTGLYRANAGARRTCERSGIPALTEPIPLSGGLSPSVIVGGIASGTARTVVETPFELVKVRWQTGGSFKAAGSELFSLSQIKEFYTGAAATWGRGTLMLTSFFILCDYSERGTPELMSRPLLGGFIKGGICATMAWAVAWPIEVVKSKVQGADSMYKGRSMLSIMGSIVKSDGVLGLYRGFAPGAMRSFTANGVGMAVYQFTQSLRGD